MLQFTLTPNNSIDIDKHAAMAIASGCQWLETDPANVDEETLDRVIDACREAGVILTFYHRDEVLEKKRVHGIHLADSDTEPTELRQRLGGHPVIGVDVNPDTPLQPLKRADADYVVLDGYPEKVTVDDIAALVKNETESGIMLPIVIRGRITPGEVQPLVDAGASGFNIDIRSLEGPEYEVSLKGFIDNCNNARR